MLGQDERKKEEKKSCGTALRCDPRAQGGPASAGRHTRHRSAQERKLRARVCSEKARKRSADVREGSKGEDEDDECGTHDSQRGTKWLAVESHHRMEGRSSEPQAGPRLEGKGSGGPRRPKGAKPKACSKGARCRRADCRFLHPDGHNAATVMPQQPDSAPALEEQQRDSVPALEEFLVRCGLAHHVPSFFAYGVDTVDDLAILEAADWAAVGCTVAELESAKVRSGASVSVR